MGDQSNSASLSTGACSSAGLYAAEHILFLDASESVLRARKTGDNTRSREFFAYYLNHLLPLKREWFREKKNVTFLSTDGLTARQVGEKVKHWCEQYI